MKWSLITFLFCLACKGILSQVEYHAKHITFANGDPITGVSDMVQDQHGLIWMGGQYGLHVYDGNRVITYARKDADVQMDIGRVNRLKMGTDGLIYLDDHEQVIKAFDPTKRILISERELQLLSTHKVQDFIISGDDFFVLEEEDYSNYILVRYIDERRDSLSSLVGYVKAEGLLQDDSTIMVSHRNGISAYAVETGEFIKRYSLDDGAFSVNPGQLTQDSYGNIYVQSNCLDVDYGIESCGVFRKEKGDTIFHLVDLSVELDLIDFNHILAIDNQLWIGGNNSSLIVHSLSDGSYDDLNDVISIANSRLRSYPDQGLTRFITQDYSGAIWYSNLGGVMRISSKRIPEYLHLLAADSDLCDGTCEIEDVIIDEDGVVYFISIEKAVRLYSHDPRDNKLRMICQYPSAVLSGKGMQILNGKVYWNRFEVSIATGAIRALFETPEPEINLIPNHMGGYDCYYHYPGLYDIAGYRLDKNMMDPEAIIIADTSYLDNEVLNRSAYNPQDGSQWIATPAQGVFRLDPDQNDSSIIHLTAGSTDRDLPTNVVSAVSVINGQVWLAHDQGVSIYNDRQQVIEKNLTVELDNHANQLSEIPFYFVHGNDSLVWLGSSKGLFIYDIQADTLVSLRHIPEIGQVDYRKGHITQDPNSKRIYIATVNGLYTFIPDELLSYTYTEPTGNLVLTKFSKWDGGQEKEVSMDLPLLSHEDIKLRYADRYYLFDFALTNYNTTGPILYSTYLEGWEPNWHPKSQEQSIQYNNLPAGNYTLNNRAYIDDIVVDEISFAIRVHQAWFKTLWFRFGALLLLASVIGLYFRLRYRNRLKNQEAINRMRAKISSDLHDDVGSMLTGLSMQSNVMSYTAEGPMKEKLKQISEISRNALETMRDTVWAIDARQDNYESLLDKMRDFAEVNIPSDSLNYNLETSGQLGKGSIPPDIRRQIYLIYKEAITNAIKHSDGDHIDIKFSRTKTKVELSIHDNGSKALNQSSPGQGLKNMKMRAAQVNGMVQVDDIKGFRVLFTCPI